MFLFCFSGLEFGQAQLDVMLSLVSLDTRGAIIAQSILVEVFLFCFF